MPRKLWTKEEEELLRKLYPATSMDEVVKAIGKSLVAIFHKAHKLGIHRTYNNKCPLQVRFENSFIPEPMSGCWLWIAAPGPDGYTQISYRHKSIRGHRASWMIYRGEIPPGMDVLHKCDCRSCVNPDHLFLGTQQDNQDDCCKKDRHSYGERHTCSKLTNEAVKTIKEDQRTYPEIAVSLNISSSTVRDIKVGKTWKHIPGPIVWKRGPYRNRKKPIPYQIHS